MVIFDEDTPAEIIAPSSPTSWSKARTGRPTQIVGRDTVEARGGRVVRIPVEEGYSTTDIIDRIKALLMPSRAGALQ